MAKMSQLYWSTPASAEYEAQTDRIYDLGAAAARAGQKPNLRGIPQQHRCFYMAGYKRAIAA